MKMKEMTRLSHGRAADASAVPQLKMRVNSSESRESDLQQLERMFTLRTLDASRASSV
jgi:hypothetical protein